MEPRLGNAVMMDVAHFELASHNAYTCVLLCEDLGGGWILDDFSPLHAEAQVEAFRLALQVLGDLYGLGINYFDLDTWGM